MRASWEPKKEAPRSTQFLPITVTILQMKPGHCWSRIYRGVKVFGAALSKIIYCLSTIFMDIANGCAVAGFAAGLWRLESSRRKRFPAPEKMARHRYKIRKKYRLLLRRRTNLISRSLAQYIVTTVSSCLLSRSVAHNRKKCSFLYSFLQNFYTKLRYFYGFFMAFQI